MSILIKGMEMPKGCYRGCPCYSYHYCNVLQRDTSDLLGTGKKLDKCPLVPVPDHGRLIDADALCKTLRNLAENEYTPETFANWIEHHIDTIIPADEEEENGQN